MAAKPPRRRGNPVARAVRRPAFRLRIVKARRGKGTYRRKGRGVKPPAEE